MKKMLVSLLLVLLWQCQPTVAPPTLGFYHWKSEMALDGQARAILDRQDYLYLRLFDIDWKEQTGEAIPVGTLQSLEQIPPHLQVIPTYFITNRTFSNLHPEQLPQLVERLFTKTRELLPPPVQTQVVGYQIDCDWTESTRAIFFEFLQLLKKELEPAGLFLSATIRLHQAKYPERTGIPPVNRGMLMFYNMSEVTDPATRNAILDLEAASKYVESLHQYPLLLDVALPLFSWGVLIREGKVVRLINHLYAEDLQDSSRFEQIAPTIFAIKKSTYLQGYYLYQADQIRLETVAPEQLLQAAALLAEQLPTAARQLIFYHLDSTILQRYDPALFEQLQRILSQH